VADKDFVVKNGLVVANGNINVAGSATATAFIGPLTGNAATATKWATARTITLGGVLSGATSIDGSGNVTLTAAHTSDPVITLTGAVTGTGTMTDLGSVSITTTATADPVLTLAGDATGTATFTNLGNATLTVAVVDDSHSHSFNNLLGKTGGTGDYTSTGTFTGATFNATSTTGGGFQGIDADTALIPSFTWTSDQNTGMWNAAADTIGFTTGGTNRLTISTTGITSTLPITAALVGNATTATTLQTARNINLGGVLSGAASFTGAGDITIIAAHTSDPVITLTGAVTGTGTMTDLGSVSITTTATSDPILTLAGDATGTATFTNLGNATLTVAVVDDSHAHSFNNLLSKTGGTGDYTSTGIFTGATFNATSTTGGGFQGIDADTALIPSFTWSADQNTGIWNAAADQMGFTTGGTNRLTISTTAITSTLPITASLVGNATTATTLQTARNINLGGVLSGSASFTGAGDITITAAHTSDPVITLTGAVTGTGTMTDLGSVSIVTTATSDPILTLAGDATGTATFTNLGNATLTVAVVDDSHSHSFDNLIGKTGGTGNYTSTGTFTGGTFNATSTTGGGFQGIDADTALIPSFTWTSDQNTGMWHAAADSIGFTTGGVNRLTISTAEVISTLRIVAPQAYVGTGPVAPLLPGQLAITSSTDPFISFHGSAATTRAGYLQHNAAQDRFLFGDVAYTESVGSFRAPAFYDTTGTTYYLKPSSALTAQSTTAGSYLNDLRINTLWNGVVPANAGPIRTSTLTSGGTGYVAGTYLSQVVSGGQGVYATYDFTVVGGIVTVATLTERGSGFQPGNTIAIPALGGTGSGGLITVNTVDTVDISIYGTTPRMRLGLSSASTAAGQEIGTIFFNTRDASAGGAGDKAFIRGAALGTSGGGEIQFWTSANGGAPTLCAVVGGANDFRLYNTAGTFNHAFSNNPTANRTLTLPDATGTVLVTNTTLNTAGYFDTGTTTPTGTARLNYSGYLYPTFLNLSGSADTATAATAYFVETGSDGFVRPKTLANVKTEIVTGAAVAAGITATALTSTATFTAGTFNATSATGGGFQGIDADTALIPSFTWTSDQNTGMWHAATDSIGFTTAGVNRLTISTTAITSTLPITATSFTGAGAGITGVTQANVTGLVTALAAKADDATVMTAGNGLSGGGSLAAARTFTMGTPGSVTATSTNAVTTTSHTHSLSSSAVRTLYAEGGAGVLGTFGHFVCTGTVAASLRSAGYQAAGSTLLWSSVVGYTQAAPAGTWELCGANEGAGNNMDKNSVWTRIL
jgi:hypothetical protein